MHIYNYKYKYKYKYNYKYKYSANSKAQNKTVKTWCTKIDFSPQINEEIGRLQQIMIYLVTRQPKWQMSDMVFNSAIGTINRNILSNPPKLLRRSFS